MGATSRARPMCSSRGARSSTTRPGRRARRRGARAISPRTTRASRARGLRVLAARPSDVARRRRRPRALAAGSRPRPSSAWSGSPTRRARGPRGRRRCASRAGIAVKMITGDHRTPPQPSPASSGSTGDVVTGADLDRMDDGELARRIDDVGVFARVAPEHKVAIVARAHRARPHRGDDRRRRQRRRRRCSTAHIGVAMGDHRHRGDQGGRRDGPHRRQLRHHRQGRRARAGRSTTTS